MFDSQFFVENRKRGCRMFRSQQLEVKSGPYVSFPLGYVALRLAILAELFQSVLFRGAAIAVASLVLTEYVFALLHEQHDELRTPLFVLYPVLGMLVQ